MLDPTEGFDTSRLTEAVRAAVADADRSLAQIAVNGLRPEHRVITRSPWADLEDTLAGFQPMPPPVPIRLTREQFDQVRATTPIAEPTAPPAPLFGAPIVLVDTVEESTPYQRGWLTETPGWYNTPITTQFGTQDRWRPNDALISLFCRAREIIERGRGMAGKPTLLLPAKWCPGEITEGTVLGMTWQRSPFVEQIVVLYPELAWGDERD
jgi:hypothetical protein